VERARSATDRLTGDRVKPDPAVRDKVAPRPVKPAAIKGRHLRLTPGVFLETRFLRPLGLSQSALAHDLGVSRRRINEIVRGHRAITLDTALRLGHYFGTGPEFWLSLQTLWDMHRVGAGRRSTGNQVSS
jgi:antitoxin HigA-1